MGTKIRIRRADGWDVVRIGRLLERGAREQAKSIWYPQPSKSSTKSLGAVLALIDRGLVIVAEAFIQEETKQGEKEAAVERRIVGAIGMAFAQDAWSDDWVLNNEWFYTHPDWRDTEIADKLLTAVEGFADTQINPATREPVKIPIILGVLTGTDAALKDMLMKRRGYQHGGSNFVRAYADVIDQEDDAAEPDSVVAGADQPAGTGDGGTGG